MKEILRLIKSWYKVIITEIVFFEIMLLISNRILSIEWQIPVLIITILLLIFIKYKVEPDLKN